MKKALPFGILCLILMVAVAVTLYKTNHNQISFIASHAEDEEGEAYDEPLARAEYEYNMMKNPVSGVIPDGVFDREMQQAREIQERQGMLRTMATNIYSYQGPDNMGGRTRAIAYDMRFNGTTNQVIMAGGVSGGVFKSTDNGATWVRKSPLNQLFSVTSIVQDPRVGFQDTWYYSSGEALGNSTGAVGAFYFGNGIYKSTDNGDTWSRLPNSNTTTIETFNARQDLISKVIVDPNSGDVYFAALDAIYRSQDGGATWANILSSGYR